MTARSIREQMAEALKAAARDAHRRRGADQLVRHLAAAAGNLDDEAAELLRRLIR